jgi:hypothetical protein
MATPFPLSLNFSSLCRERGQGEPIHTTEKEQHSSPLLFHVLLSLWQVASCLCWLKQIEQRRRKRKVFCYLNYPFCPPKPEYNQSLSIYKRYYNVAPVKFWNIVLFTASLEMMKDLCWHRVNYIRAILYKIRTNVNISLWRIWPIYLNFFKEQIDADSLFALLYISLCSTVQYIYKKYTA